MRIVRILIKLWLCLCGYSLVCNASSAQTTNTPVQITNILILVQRAPEIDGMTFCCDAMVHAVNGLRHLGKDDALTVLRTYLRENGGTPDSEKNEKVLLICRLLFVNPQGWSFPRLGGPYPEVDWKVAEKNPLFPLVVSHGAPFLLIMGYNSTGYTSDTADKCVESCAGFSLVHDDLAENGYEDAARALFKDESFQHLYLDPKALIYREKMIMDQAQCLDPVTRRGGLFKSSIEVKMGNDSR